MFFRFALVLLTLAGFASAQTSTKNIILITADGLRWQDLFGGIDGMLMQEKPPAWKTPATFASVCGANQKNKGGRC
jgi:hypothetical protein